MFYKQAQLIHDFLGAMILSITKTTTSQDVCFVIMEKHVSSNSTEICNKCLNTAVFQIKQPNFTLKYSKDNIQSTVALFKPETYSEPCQTSTMDYFPNSY